MSTWTNFEWTVTDDGVGILVLDRPDRLNALTFDVYADLVKLFAWLGTPDGDAVRAVVLTGRGKGFCSGGDVGDIMGVLKDADLEKTLAFTRMTCDVIRGMKRAPQPIVAAVNGTAAGAGAVMALAADLRVVAQGAKIHFLFTKVALTGADMGAAWLLPRVVGEARAAQALLFGDGIPSHQALAWGLANEVVPNDQVLETATSWARRLASGPQEALRITKRALVTEATMSLDAALDYEANAQALLLRTADHREFLEAQAAERDPKYR